MNNNIIVIDDDKNILESYAEILDPSPNTEAVLASVWDEEIVTKNKDFNLRIANQGKDGYELAKQAVEEENPFAVAFIDMRMPPGWDGLETAKALRKLDERIYIVIVTAFADKSADEMQEALKYDILLLKKPFTNDEVYQLARNLCNAWTIRKEKEQFQEIMKEREADLAYESGKSEMVLNTLHNIGNIIGPVTLATMKLKEGCHNIGKIAEIFEDLMNKDLNKNDFNEEMKSNIEALRAIETEDLADNLAIISTGSYNIDEVIRIQQAEMPDKSIWITEINLPDYIREICKLTEDTFKKNSISVKLDLSDEVENITIPKNPFRQMLTNFLQNAEESIVVRHREDKNFKGEILITTEPEDNDFFKLSVKDNGTGIDKELFVDIFRHGYTTKEKCSGFGLHSAANFVQSSKGNINVKSAGKNKGTEFYISLPKTVVVIS